ncbi:hypothetical protein BAE44_0000900, partial [Dichanthelium oligosanthes]
LRRGVSRVSASRARRCPTSQWWHGARGFTCRAICADALHRSGMLEQLRYSWRRSYTTTLAMFFFTLNIVPVHCLFHKNLC